jgi:hypothetical protein
MRAGGAIPRSRPSHLRGTDRLAADKRAEYVANICGQMGDVGRNEPLLVVSDCLPLFQQFQSEFPSAVLRTPHLDGFDPHVGTQFQNGGRPKLAGPRDHNRLLDGHLEESVRISIACGRGSDENHGGHNAPLPLGRLQN